jgi:membrane protein
MRWLLAPFRLVIRVVHRFRTERLAQTAAALSFATLLGLVPMIAVGIGLVSHLPFAEGMNAALEKFLLANLLPDKAGVVIAKYLGQFAHRAAGVTVIGLAALTATAVMQMLTIEHAFNAIWNIKAKRPWLRRVAMHLIALLLGPLVFGGSLAFISFVAGISFGLVDEPSWVSAAFFRALSFAFMAGLFALLYWGVPNRPVARWHAIAGGVLAALCFIAMQRLFGAYLANFSAYAVVYGAFAAVPIFLAWLYLSWGVILVGALAVAELPGSIRS